MESGALRAHLERAEANRGEVKFASQPAADDDVHIELRLRLPVVWLVLLLAAALLLPDRVWNTLLIGLGGLFLVAYFWARQLATGLTAERRLRFGWVSVGDRLEELFTLANHCLVPALWVDVIDQSNVPGYRVRVVRSVGSGGTDRWRQAAVCERRGQFTMGPWAIRSGDPFGIFVVTRRYGVSDEIIIHPPIHSRLPIPLPAGESSGRTRAQRRSRQSTMNAAGVRDYQPDDPQHLIHWRTSARKDSLYVRQFDQDAAGDIWLLLDLNAGVQLGSGPDGTEEHAVLLAAAMAARALQENRAVGLATYGRRPQVIVPGRGQGQQWRILRALALVEADGNTSPARALQDLSQVASRGTTVAFITPAADTEWTPQLFALAEKGVQSNVILLDRPSFGGAESSEAVAEAIRRQGFSGTLFRRGELGSRPEEGERRGYWRFRVTGTGRVITLADPWGRIED